VIDPIRNRRDEHVTILRCGDQLIFCERRIVRIELCIVELDHTSFDRWHQVPGYDYARSAFDTALSGVACHIMGARTAGTGASSGKPNECKIGLDALSPAVQNDHDDFSCSYCISFHCIASRRSDGGSDARGAVLGYDQDRQGLYACGAE